MTNFTSDDDTTRRHCATEDEVFRVTTLEYMIQEARKMFDRDFPVTFHPEFHPTESVLAMAWDDTENPTRLHVQLRSPAFHPLKIMLDAIANGSVGIELPEGLPKELEDALAELLNDSPFDSTRH